ncbi:MAG: BON domain-containing protein [Chloroflexia bacterium]
MDDKQSARDHDSCDTRTGEGERANPTVQRDTPSDYTMRQIGEGNTPLDEEMDSLIDPSMEDEEMSANPDVLNLDSTWRVEGEEPDFMGDPGATDLIEAVEEGEPYFPPTDPPLRTDDGLQGVEIPGGLAATSLEEPGDTMDQPLRLQTNDEEVAERVRYALLADAYTTDLNIEVEVEGGTVLLHGKVRSLDDIEQAEQIAGSVPGVEEVEEDLEIV